LLINKQEDELIAGYRMYRHGLNRFLWPPSMVIRQLASIVFFSNLVGWKKFGGWLKKHSIKSLPVAAGAIGMGCIGFPNHPVYEITERCNLRCVHCHTNGGGDGRDELSTREAKDLIDGIAEIPEFRMIVFSGGEPLIREDFFDLLHYSKSKGLYNIIASNGTLIDDNIAKELKKAGVTGVAISLDSTEPKIHNKIRRNSKAFELAMRGIEAVKKAGMLLQLNATVMKYNFEDLRNLVQFADDLKSSILLMYQLVPVGRGCAIKDATLDFDKNKLLVKYISQLQKEVSMIIETVAGPYHWPYLMEKANKNNKLYIKLAEKIFHGCTAGRGLVYIKPNGDVWPCPFMDLKAGNVREKPLQIIWRTSKIFKDLRKRHDLLKGKCSDCEYNVLCGGCRDRALVSSGDYMGGDEYCFLR